MKEKYLQPEMTEILLSVEQSILDGSPGGDNLKKKDVDSDGFWG